MIAILAFNELISTDQKEDVNIGTARIKNNKFGVNIDSKLNFDKQIKIIRSKAQGKRNVLKKLVPLMIIEKRKLIMNAFFNSHFSYYFLTWKFQNRSLNIKINRLNFSLKVI